MRAFFPDPKLLAFLGILILMVGIVWAVQRDGGVPTIGGDSAPTCESPPTNLVKISGNSQISGAFYSDATIDDIRLTEKNDLGRAATSNPPLSIGTLGIFSDSGTLKVWIENMNGERISNVFKTNYDVGFTEEARKYYSINAWVRDGNCNGQADSFTGDFIVILENEKGKEVARRTETFTYRGS